MAAVLKDQGVSTVLRFPAMWSVGAAWNPKPAWTVEADFNVHEWKVFNDLPIDFESALTPDKRKIEDYGNAWQARTGAEYRRGCLAYRAGYYFDKSPAPVNAVTPLLPDADRHGLTLGLGCASRDRQALDGGRLRTRHLRAAPRRRGARAGLAVPARHVHG